MVLLEKSRRVKKRYQRLSQAHRRKVNELNEDEIPQIFGLRKIFQILYEVHYKKPDQKVSG
jgi:hypothetical protein